jgi:hypothetical protein
MSLSTLRPALRLARAVLLTASMCGLAGALGGCVTGGPADSYASMGGGGTVAFDSVDGPPPQVFDRMVSILDSESKLRRVPVVSRETGASYRVRSYLSAQIRGNRTIIAWVWDVYDRNQQRTLRLSGEESTGKAGRDAWAQADDVVLRRIAQAGLTGLGGLVNGALPAEPSTPASSRGPAVASVVPETDSGTQPVQQLSFAER